MTKTPQVPERPSAWPPPPPPPPAAQVKLTRANELNHQLGRLKGAREHLTGGAAPKISIEYLRLQRPQNSIIPLTEAATKQIEALMIEDVESQQRTLQAEFDALWASHTPVLTATGPLPYPPQPPTTP